MYTVKNDGTGLTKVDNHWRDFHSVYLLPDGSKAVFAAHAADGYSQIYYLAPVDSSSEPVQLTTTPIHKMSPMLSADGSKIVFVQTSPLMQPDYDFWKVDIAIMNADGSNLNVIPAPLAMYLAHPSFSPDGSKLTAQFYGAGFGGDAGIFIMNADGTDPRRITPGGADGIAAERPAFSPDGNQIVFSSVGEMGVYIVNTDGSGLKKLTDYGWDPLFVGDRIMFVKQDQIYKMKLDGTEVSRVTQNGQKHGFEMFVWWQP